MSNPSTQFKKGQSGNPKGRPPRDWTWDSLYRDAVDELDDKGIPIKVTIAKRLATLAARGDTTAIKMLADRMDGMPQQKTDVTSGGKPIQAPILGGITKDDLRSDDSDTETS